MSQPTKTQWDEIAKQLDSLLERVYLRCDGYLVCAGLVRTSKNGLSISIYINGFFRGKWLLQKDGKMTEEARRFLRPSIRSKYPPKFIKGMEKAIGKRQCKKEGYHEKDTVIMIDWKRPQPFINHLKKHNEQIEILTREEHQTALEELESEVANND